MDGIFSRNPQNYGGGHSNANFKKFYYNFSEIKLSLTTQCEKQQLHGCLEFDHVFHLFNMVEKFLKIHEHVLSNF